MLSPVSSVLKVNDIIETKGVKPTETPTHIGDVVYYFQDYIDEILKDLSISFRIDGGANDNQPYTIVDVRNLRGLNNNQIKSLFSNNFAIDIETNEGIDKINYFYQNAIEYIERRYGRKIPDEVRTKRVNDTTDIKSILDSTGKGISGIFYCAIAKIIFSMIPTQSDVRIIGIGKIHKEINEYVSGPIYGIDEVAEGVEEGTIKMEEIGKDIPVVLYHRSKELDSIYGKEMGNANYKNIDDFKDLHGFTLEMDSQEPLNMILMIQRYYFMLREKAKLKKDDDEAEIDIENKNMISLEDLEEYKSYIDPDFYEILYDAIKKSITKTTKKKEEKGTNENYKDIKITIKFRSSNPKGKYLGDVYSGTEFKLVQKGNNNERGLSFHPIFDYKKRLRELTRIFGFVTKFDLVFFVNEFFDKLDENLMKKGKKRGTYLRELIEDLKSDNECTLGNDFQYIPNDDENLLAIKKALFYHFESELVKAKMTEGSKTYFYVHRSYFKLAPELQPELFTIN